MSNPTESHSLAEHEPAEHRAAEPIDLLGYLKRMGHYWIAGLVAAVIVAGALLGFGATRGSDPVGSTWAKAHVMVTLPEPRTTALGAASADAGTRVLSSYVAVSDSDLLINDAVKRLGDGTKPATLKAATSLYSGGGSQILAVYALGTDEAQAQKRANAYAQALVANGSTLLPQAVQGLGTPTFTVVEKAAPSSASPDPAVSSGASSSTALLTSPVIAVVLGLVAGVIVMGVAEITVGRRRS
ncbi:hypothetical protein [Acidipropionibacterium acidipropionici]|uniref:hypothetical protein n=1 Tax=Acidipropionibacterium acidipropionici TaxID=1748 RepID=UPI000683E8C0|nr:hypothetical protein [Acidipropionibacterium acidipropionici]APZ09915.1 hypothetical protein BWX38_12440 [Acidipropionibacterium acidipropionici]